MARIKKVRVHGPIGAYEHSDDNAPLEGLAANDVILQDQVDAAYSKLQDSLDVEFDRESFVPLSPETARTQVYVNPGTFLCRMPVRSGPFEGLGRGSGLNTRRGGLDSDKSRANVLAGTEYHQMGESQRSSVIFFPGGHVSFDAWKDEDFNYFREHQYEDWVSDAPKHRLDLICVQGYPAQDQFGKNPTVLSNEEMQPKLVVVKGAGFRNAPAFRNEDNTANMYADADPNITWAPIWGNTIGVDKYRETITSNSAGITKAKTYGMGKTSVEKFSSTRTFGTTPAPDDIINAAFHIRPGLVDDYFNVGLFCVPVAYVKIPRGYAGGNIKKEWISDIRPFFRSTELTLSERQGIANSYLPEASNRFLTVFDSDYQALVDYVMREDQWNAFELRGGQRTLTPGNHEGRIRAMEAATTRPRLQVAPRTSYVSLPESKLRPKYPTVGSSRQPPWGIIWGNGPKPARAITSPGYNPGTGISYSAGLLLCAGQHIPAIRNYLDRFYSDDYNYSRIFTELDTYERLYQKRVYGGHNATVRRIVNRKWFLNYNTNAWNGWEYTGGDITEYPAAEYRTENRRRQNRTIHDTSKPAKMDDGMLNPNDKYKLQIMEIDFEFPAWDVDRDKREECEQVWHEHCFKGDGWTGFGHGGSWECEGHYITRCVTIGGGKTIDKELPHMGIPLGYAPYWIDCDALGFAQGAIDALQIQIANCNDTANDYGTFMWYRFAARRPYYVGRPYGTPWSADTVHLKPNPKECTLDERERKLDPEVGDWVFNAVGETQSFTAELSQDRYTAENGGSLPTNFVAHQISPGYNGFAIMTNMPIIARNHSSSWETEWQNWDWNPFGDWGGHGWTTHTVNWTTPETGHRKKRCKIKITGPAHRYFNGAYLPTGGNSDSGDTPLGYDWID